MVNIVWWEALKKLNTPLDLSSFTGGNQESQLLRFIRKEGLQW